MVPNLYSTPIYNKNWNPSKQATPLSIIRLFPSNDYDHLTFHIIERYNLLRACILRSKNVLDSLSYK